MDDDLIEIYDRFSFDALFRILLSEDFDAEESITFILQNRVFNKYYLKIDVNDKISDDLKELFQEELRKLFINKN